MNHNRARKHSITHLSTFEKVILLYFVLSATVFADEKLPEDPTKIVTKAGFSFADELSLSGSIGLDETRKVNARVNEDASEWRVGGSWLFKRGIVNFNIGQNEFDNGASQTSYSIGTFVPLSIFGMTPGGWQIFPMAGYNYNDGEVAVENLETDIQSDYILMPTTSHGGYLGAFALRPLTDQWTLMSFGGGAIGSNDYSGYWAGAGAGYKINDNHSFNLSAFYSDNTFGQDDKVVFSYTCEFD